jgi:hypothetical protein
VAPPTRGVRARSVVAVYYGFGDASGAGFGDTLLTSEGIVYRGGIWGDDLQAKSSNFRKLFNLTEAMESHVAELWFPHLCQLVHSFEEVVADGSWIAAEVYMFTDNAVLFELILHLQTLELPHALQLHIIHVSGRGMQAQGMDHLPQGILHSSVLSGSHMLDFIPLHLSVASLSQGIVPWCLSWLLPGCTLTTLDPLDWFFKGHGLVAGSHNGDGVWQPALVTSSFGCSSGLLLLQRPMLQWSNSPFPDISAQICCMSLFVLG